MLSSDLLLVLAGGAGTLSEARLALEYERPVAAFLRERSELDRLPADILLLTCFSDVQVFFSESLRGLINPKKRKRSAIDSPRDE